MQDMLFDLTPSLRFTREAHDATSNFNKITVRVTKVTPNGRAKGIDSDDLSDDLVFILTGELRESRQTSQSLSARDVSETLQVEFEV